LSNHHTQKLNILQIRQYYRNHKHIIANAVVKALQKEGHDVSVLFIYEAPSPEIESDLKCRTICLQNGKSGKRPGKRTIVKFMRELFRREPFDAIITHRYRPCALAAKAATGSSAGKKIAVFHNLYIFKRFRRKLFARFYLKNWTLVGVSSAVTEDLINSKSGFTKNRVVTIPNAIRIADAENAFLPREKAREKLGIPEHAFTFGNIGRLSPTKGQDNLIDAFARIAQNAPDSYLVIAGDGSYKNKLLEAINRSSLKSRILLTGYLENGHQYLKALDAFVFPSKKEAFGKALLEAMVARLPVIAANAPGGIQELLGSYKHMYDINDIDRLSELMLAMYGMSNGERENIGRQLYDRAVARFDIEHLETAYQRLVRLP